jgi:hypothetical protein
MAEAQKGIFDHLAEYLLQPNAGGPASAPRAPDTQASAGGEETLVREELETKTRAGVEEGGQTLVFVETAEKLVVEKEVFVREEVVLSKLIENHVQEVDDTVRRTEVEVERLAPDEAERILERDAPTGSPAAAPPEKAKEAPAPAAPTPAMKPEAQAPPPVPEVQPGSPGHATLKQARRSGQHSAAWWMWFALIVCAAVLIAFAAAQFLGSASG